MPGMSGLEFCRQIRLQPRTGQGAGGHFLSVWRQAAHPSAALRAGLAEAIHLRSTEKAELTAPLRPDLADRSLKGAVLDFQRQLSELKPKEPLRQEQEHRYGNL